MYVSQVPAILLYTILKTILLILLIQTIYSICAWMDRYDLAKIFEQGSLNILIGSLKTNKYNKYSGMFLCLFISIIFEIIIGLLPTIATKCMPFESIIINDGIYSYFKTNFSTPVQNVPIPSNYHNMDAYCKDMELCDTNRQYYDNIANISETMEIIPIDFDFNKDQFTTEFVNITIFTKEDSNYKYYFNESFGNYGILKNDTNSITSNLISSTYTKFKYNNNEKYTRYTKYLLPMYYGDYIDTISVSNVANIVYSDGQNQVLVVIKTALYNCISYFGEDNINSEAFNYVFNDSQYYNILKNSNNTINTEYLGMYHDTLYYTNKINNSLVINFLQYSKTDDNPGSGITRTLAKSKTIINTYVIKDKNFKIKNIDENIKNIINFNMTYCNETIDNTDYHPMFDNFNKKPSENLFMYSILTNSDNIIYGLQGKRKIVANISPIFIGFITSNIILLIIFCTISRYIKDKKYFSTLLENIGIINLYNINNNNEKNEILLKDEELIT